MTRIQTDHQERIDRFILLPYHSPATQRTISHLFLCFYYAQLGEDLWDENSDTPSRRAAWANFDLAILVDSRRCESSKVTFHDESRFSRL